MSALTFGLRATGYEISPRRVEGARRALDRVEAWGGPAQLVDFRLADVLTCDVSRASVVYLTDLLWDEPLCLEVAQRVARQLTCSEDGAVAVVVANKPYWKHNGFKLVAQVSVPVSWVKSQNFYLFQLDSAAAEASRATLCA